MRNLIIFLVVMGICASASAQYGGGGYAPTTDTNAVNALIEATALQNVAEDTTPQLGGNLDANGKSITNIAASSLGFVGGFSIGITGGSNLLMTATDGAINTNAHKAYVDTADAGLQGNITANDSDIADLESAVNRGEQVSMELGLQLSVVSGLDGIPYSYGFWDSYGATNLVDGAASSNLNYDATDNFYYSMIVAGVDPIAHYLLNDNAASTVVDDDTTGAHDGVLSGANTTDISVAGKINAAFDFNGTSHFVDIADHNAFSFGDGSTDSPFSIAAWINADDWTFCNVVVRDVDVTNGEYMFGGDSANSFSVSLFDANKSNYLTCRTTGNMTAHEGVWVHCVFTYNGDGSNTGMNIYTNGQPVAAVTRLVTGSYTAMHNTTSTTKIGRRTIFSTKWFNGRVDDLRIYNIELTASQVSDLYNGGTGTETQPSVGGLPFVLVSEPNEQLTPPTQFSLSTILGTSDQSVTNLRTYASNDNGATFDEVLLTYQRSWNSGLGTSLYVGSTNFTSSTSSETNVIVKHEASTNGVQVHGTSILTD